MLCEQQRHRLACASVQSDQCLCSSLLDSLLPVLAKAEMSRLKLVSVAEQDGLSLTWSHTSEDRFSRVVAQI